jgi:pimeloyl-ACP methyl ester carboxylesterase
MKVYCISGLGADRRVFSKLRFPQQYQVVHLSWIEPEKEEELETYAMRMAEKIDRGEPFILCGLSMGGMVASCIAARLRPTLTILLSSIPVSSELPQIYRLAGTLQLHRILPISFFTSAAMFKRYLTGETPADKALIRQMIRDTDEVFIRWAFSAVLRWKFSQRPEPLIHIHGTRDGILPVRHTRPTHFIKGGDHLMVLSRAEEINLLLEKLLDER